MSYELAEKMEGLKSRLDLIITGQADKNKKDTLIALQDRLTKLTLVAIVQELQTERAEYQAAIKGLNEAIEYIDKVPGKLSHFTKGIRMVTQAVQLTEKVVKSVAPV